MSSVPVSIIEQCKAYSYKGNRLASFIGTVIGTVVPVMVYAVTHKLPSLHWYEFSFWVLAIMGLGGCFFSMKSVIQWGLAAFNQDKAKAVAFALLLEGMLVMSGMFEDMAWLGYTSLAYLCLINGLSAGCNIALQSKEYLREKREANPKPKKKK